MCLEYSLHVYLIDNDDYPSSFNFYDISVSTDVTYAIYYLPSFFISFC